jgi:hypothetical protein
VTVSGQGELPPAESAGARKQAGRNSFVSAAIMAVKLYDQGKKDGLSNEEIFMHVLKRQHIPLVLHQQARTRQMFDGAT